MRIALMCAVPTSHVDGGPACVDGRGGQIYHGATPGFLVNSPSHFSVGVAVSFLLHYESDDVEVSHLEFVVGTARMFGEVIGATRNDFALNPFGPVTCELNSKRVATYENVPLSIECSCNGFGLIELTWALKVNTRTEPVDVDQRVYVRSWNLPDVEEAMSSEEFDEWQAEEIRLRKRSRFMKGSVWSRLMGQANQWKPIQ